MRRSIPVVSVIMTVVMLMSFTACSAFKVKEYDKDSFTDVLTGSLGISQDDIATAENDGNNGYPKATVVTAATDGARVLAYFCDDAEDARSNFKKTYDSFKGSFNSDKFKGSSINMSTDSAGYIVLKGDNPGTSIFGDRYRTGSIYAGIYYSGSMIVTVMPDKDNADDGVKKVIDALGFPNV